MRSAVPNRTLLVVGALAVALSTVVVGGASANAAGGADAPPPTVSVLADPTRPGPTSSRAHPPSGATRFSATTSPEVAALPATPQGAPQSIIGDPESVIGADGRTRLTLAATSAFPLSAIGQIELRFPDGPTYICSGYLIDGNSLLTAGHCSFAGGQDLAIAAATFSPGRNRSHGVVVNPFGSCAVTGVWAPGRWRHQGQVDHDYSVQQLSPDCDYRDSAGSLGLFALPLTDGFAGQRLRVEGYPGDKGYGSRWKMVGVVYPSSTTVLHYPMDTAGGQSGSPVFNWHQPSCGACSAGVHAYGAWGDPPMNSGPLLTADRISTILAVAAENGG